MLQNRFINVCSKCGKKRKITGKDFTRNVQEMQKKMGNFKG